MTSIVFTSAWEWKCYYFPDLAIQEYTECLSLEDQAKLAADDSMQNVLRGYNQ